MLYIKAMTLEMNPNASANTKPIILNVRFDVTLWYFIVILKQYTCIYLRVNKIFEF